ncbi:MAG: hypothetical protein Q8761_02875, partial [Sweet potato little leaf phytoplasma]|nr:hypothetical protein [Sweet potato little leaf phytoplasma]
EQNISQKPLDDITWQQKIEKMLYCSRVIRQTDSLVIKSLVNLSFNFIPKILKTFQCVTKH